MHLSFSVLLNEQIPTHKTQSCGDQSIPCVQQMRLSLLGGPNHAINSYIIPNLTFVKMQEVRTYLCSLKAIAQGY